MRALLVTCGSVVAVFAAFGAFAGFHELRAGDPTDLVLIGSFMVAVSFGILAILMGTEKGKRPVIAAVAGVFAGCAVYACGLVLAMR